MNTSPQTPDPEDIPRRLRELAGLFLRLGTTAFGGPAAHIAMMQDEVVSRRKWMTETEFLDLIAATNLIPGPNSTEMAIHIGYGRAGWRGLLVAGSAFIIPAVLIVGVLAELYVRYGKLPPAPWLLYGIKPVLIAIIIQAIWTLARPALKTPLLQAVGAVSLLLSLFGQNELAVLFGMGALMVAREAFLRRRAALNGTVLPLVPFLFTGAASAASTAFSVQGLFWFFARTGAVLYGSGYVLVAFIQNGLVARSGWLTQNELLDAVAAGQITPGPLFTTATFIGYLLGEKFGTGGIVTGLAATAGIFAPAFVFVAITGPFVHRLRESPYSGAFLDGIVAASLALMAAVTLSLGAAAIRDIPTALITLASALLLIRFRLNSTWLVLGAAPLGWLLHLAGFV